MALQDGVELVTTRPTIVSSNGTRHCEPFCPVVRTAQ
jgi:hypothetical protein